MIEADQWLSIARWAKHDRCVMPELVDHGVWLDNGRHILLGLDPDPRPTVLVTPQSMATSNPWRC